MIYSFSKKVVLLIISNILLVTGFALPQSYLVHTYNENDGLSNSVVYDAAQDTLGQLWFATRAGISVYDGSQWKSFTVVEGLPATSYSKVVADEQGIIWILPYAPNLAFSLFTNDKWTHLPKPEISGEILNFSTFEVVYIDQKRMFFVVTDQAGLYQFADEQWRQITVDQCLLSN